MTRPFIFLFIFLLGLLTMFSIGFFQEKAYVRTMGVHPVDPFLDHQKKADFQITKPTLLIHTGTEEDRSNGLSLGYIVSLLMVGVMGSLVMIGVRRKGEIGPYFPWLLGSFIIMALIFSGLAWSYSGYLRGDTDAIIGGYPAPTAWMIYGVWLFPLILITLFVVTFDRWFLSKEDLGEFREWVQANQQEGGNHG